MDERDCAVGRRDRGAMPHMDKVIDFINVNRERYLEELKALLAIPSISALPEHAGDVKRCAEWCADEMRRIGLQNVRLDRDAGQSRRLRRLAGRAGRADDSLLRPLRRAAGRSARPVGIAAVRGDDSRRRDLRARLGRRQGPGLHALQGGRGAPEAERPPAGEHQVHPRRRRRSRQRATSTTSSAPTRPSSPPTSSSSPTRRCSRAACRRSATACAASSTSRSICAAATPICTPDRSAARSRIPAFVLAQMIAQMKDRGGRIKIPGLLRRCGGRCRRRSARRGRRCRSTRRSTRRTSGSRSCSARPTTRRSSGRGRGRRSRSTACCPASPARARRPCCRPWRWRRSACGSCRIRIRTRSPSSSRPTCKKLAPKTVELKVTRMHGGKPWMTSFDNPFVQAAGRAIEKGFGKKPVFTREGGSIPVVSTFQEELGLPSVLFGVGLPDENAHAPNEKLDVGELPQRHHRVGVSLRRDRQDRSPADAACRDSTDSIGRLRTFYGALPSPPPIRSRCSCGKCCRCTRCRASATRRSAR